MYRFSIFPHPQRRGESPFKSRKHSRRGGISAHFFCTRNSRHVLFVLRFYFRFPSPRAGGLPPSRTRVNISDPISGSPQNGDVRTRERGGVQGYPGTRTEFKGIFVVVEAFTRFHSWSSNYKFWTTFVGSRPFYFRDVNRK